MARDVGMYGKGECRCLVVEHMTEVDVMTGWVEQDIIMYTCVYIVKVRWIKVATKLLKVYVENVFGWSVGEVQWGFFGFGGCVGSGGEGGGCRWCGK